MKNHYMHVIFRDGKNDIGQALFLVYGDSSGVELRKIIYPDGFTANFNVKDETILSICNDYCMQILFLIEGCEC